MNGGSSNANNNSSNAIGNSNSANGNSSSANGISSDVDGSSIRYVSCLSANDHQELTLDQPELLQRHFKKDYDIPDPVYLQWLKVYHPSRLVELSVSPLMLHKMMLHCLLYSI